MAHAAELTHLAWAELSPFLVKLPPRETAKGVDKFAWDKWGVKAPPLDNEQQAAIWAMCDRILLYDVHEVGPPAP
jgi:hypothetical protein